MFGITVVVVLLVCGMRLMHNQVRNHSFVEGRGIRHSDGLFVGKVVVRQACPTQNSK